ncbi:hypothetical protein [Streptomyces sp. R35]|uniref:Uncharacterized protein n=1 Tax=Streptomyces sp. R35 TaxID=3238630 RepID=A0AB39S7M0_9ACTN
MSAWDESSWVDYDAEVLNVFAGGGTAWIEYRYTIWYVGWRRIRTDSSEATTGVLGIATSAKQSGTTVRVRVTDGGGPDGLAEITAIQTK